MRYLWTILLMLCSGISLGCVEGTLESGGLAGAGGMATGMTGMQAGGVTGGGNVGAPMNVGGGMAPPPPSTPTAALDPQLPPGTVIFTTSMGVITLVLDTQKAPNTVANFQSYIDEGFYDGDDGLGGTTFHRVIKGFMIQGGGVTLDGQLKVTRAPIPHEGNTTISNVRGTIAMARTDDPDSATSQFFINHTDNTDSLDFMGPDIPGYVAFGRVTQGMEVVDAIADMETGAMDVPTTAVTIDDVRRGP